MTVDPFAARLIGQWALVRGERYGYILSLKSDGDWHLRSLALSVLPGGGGPPLRPRQMERPARRALRRDDVPHYDAQGEAERG